MEDIFVIEDNEAGRVLSELCKRNMERIEAGQLPLTAEEEAAETATVEEVLVALLESNKEMGARIAMLEKRAIETDETIIKYFEEQSKRMTPVLEAARRILSRKSRGSGSVN